MAGALQHASASVPILADDSFPNRSTLGRATDAFVAISEAFSLFSQPDRPVDGSEGYYSSTLAGCTRSTELACALLAGATGQLKADLSALRVTLQQPCNTREELLERAGFIASLQTVLHHPGRGAVDDYDGVSETLPPLAALLRDSPSITPALEKLEQDSAAKGDYVLANAAARFQGWDQAARGDFYPEIGSGPKHRAGEYALLHAMANGSNDRAVMAAAAQIHNGVYRVTDPIARTTDPRALGPKLVETFRRGALPLSPEFETRAASVAPRTSLGTDPAAWIARGREHIEQVAPGLWQRLEAASQDSAVLSAHHADDIQALMTALNPYFRDADIQKGLASVQESLLEGSRFSRTEGRALATVLNVRPEALNQLRPAAAQSALSMSIRLWDGQFLPMTTGIWPAGVEVAETAVANITPERIRVRAPSPDVALPFTMVRSNVAHEAGHAVEWTCAPDYRAAVAIWQLQQTSFADPYERNTYPNGDTESVSMGNEDLDNLVLLIRTSVLKPEKLALMVAGVVEQHARARSHELSRSAQARAPEEPKQPQR